MICFKTEFPVESNVSFNDFIVAIREWILGSPYTSFTTEDLNNLEEKQKFDLKKLDDHLEIMGFESGAEEARAVRHTKNAKGLEWELVAILSRQEKDCLVGIQVSCQSSNTALRLPPVKKPILVDALLTKLGGGADGRLVVGSTPRFLADIEIDLAAQCINSSPLCRLPIIYVSADFRGRQLIDVKKIAKSLSGMAHVLVEPNRHFSIRLKSEVDSENVYGGTIGVYWPNGAGRRSFFVGPQFDTSDEMQTAIVEEVRIALTNRRTDERCEWSTVQGMVSKLALEELKRAGSNDIDQFIANFSGEITAKDQRIASAENEIQRLQAERRKYEARNPLGSGLLIQTGNEQEFYANEMLSIICDALKAAIPMNPADSRRRDVLKSIVDANDVVSDADAFREQLKNMLRGYRSMDSKLKSDFERMGFLLTSDGRHWKLCYQGDDRYTFALPKSSSDSRAGLNAASSIAKRVF
ncbi:MAG TPA: hypothetical protein VG711_02830 [Phycisphaerales bacterium]|nr:hypothetical protein [Phycisphaerales bacterium]